MNPFNSINQPAQITYYSGNGNVYVANADGISVWDLEGNKQTTTGTFSSGSATAINGIAIGQSSGSPSSRYESRSPRKPSSSTTGTASCCALVSLLPASSPATT